MNNEMSTIYKHYCDIENATMKHLNILIYFVIVMVDIFILG